MLFYLKEGISYELISWQFYRAEICEMHVATFYLNLKTRKIFYLNENFELMVFILEISIK